MVNNKKVIMCEVFSRVVGYFRPTNNWNKGKVSEFNQRKDFTEKQSFHSNFGITEFITEKLSTTTNKSIQSIEESDNNILMIEN